MVDIRRKTYERNGIETLVDSGRALWQNDRYMEEGFDHKNLPIITKINSSNYKKHRYELVHEPERQPTRIVLTDELEQSK